MYKRTALRPSILMARGTFYLGLFAALVAPAANSQPCAVSGKAIPQIELQEVAGGFKQPVHITHANDGSDRLFIVEQRGVIRVIENGRARKQPFLDIRERVTSGDEKGLLSVAFHPRYRENGFFYVNYTYSHRFRLRTRVSRFRRTAFGRADPRSEAILLTIDQPYRNHNGGQLAFGPDGYLYIGMGDGGAADDPHGHGQNPRTLLGTLLRIDVDKTSGPKPYAVPKDNPFVGKPGFLPEIWAFGLRNPWRFSFDARSGLLYLADVGQNAMEEVDVIKKGGNYGWNVMEGSICTPGVNKNCNPSGLELPILTYPHPEGFSITGGFVYRGGAIPGLCGVYLYGDYVTRRIWGLRYDGAKVTARKELLRTRHAVSSFGQDQNLELYLVDHESGEILRMIPPTR